MRQGYALEVAVAQNSVRKNIITFVDGMYAANIRNNIDLYDCSYIVRELKKRVGDIVGPVKWTTRDEVELHRNEKHSNTT